MICNLYIHIMVFNRIWVDREAWHTKMELQECLRAIAMALIEQVRKPGWRCFVDGLLSSRRAVSGSDFFPFPGKQVRQV